MQMLTHTARSQNPPAPSCIHRLLQTQAERQPDATAILAPGRPALTYARLWDQVGRVVGALNARGVGRGDRVALVLPNGPEMAVAFVAVAAGAANAPLNPAYTGSEFDFYLSDLNARALVIAAGSDSPAREVARDKGIPVIELSLAAGAPAGVFSLSGGEPPSRLTAAAANPEGRAEPDFAGPDDLALVLHTSGTTSRPKVVPLTQRSICASAEDVKKAAQLNERDCCLNVMPLFHVYGIVVVLSTLASGGSVVCAPGFDDRQFFGWMEEFRPTWYTVVPTIHQAILERARANPETVTRGALRFVSSSSSPLTAQVKAELEALFQVPVRESYGMTEACLITGNPLIPDGQKAGSVGPAVGPEVAIMGEQGFLLPPGTTGEVVIRGPSVMAGYENDPAANESAFVQGWFRTGDQGYLDEDGYLFLTGRIKEIINRGGEKISPREIDERLMEHPAVMQAVTFAAPHSTLGETVAAAVRLREGARATAAEIRASVAARLAPYKVPDPVLILDELPKGPTGKLQRIGLAQQLGLGAGPAEGASNTPATEPRTPVEEKLVQIWTELLGTGPVTLEDSFMQAGGDSIRAVQLIARVWEEYHVLVPLPRLFETPSVAGLAIEITRGLAQQSQDQTALLLTELERLSEEEIAARLAGLGRHGQ